MLFGIADHGYAARRFVVRILKDRHAARGGLCDEPVDVLDRDAELQGSRTNREHVALTMQAQSTELLGELEAHGFARQIVEQFQSEHVAIEVARSSEIRTDQHDG